MELLQITGAILVLLGAIVLCIAAIGLLRMPDAYLRVQVGTKASTAGVALIMVGLSLLFPSGTGKFLIILLFVMMTNPVSSNMLMRAAHRMGQPMTDQTVIDQLAEDEKTTTSDGNL